ncbi:MAG: flagellar hook-associated protein FlgK [Gemmatimonadaceae bacterium]
MSTFGGILSIARSAINAHQTAIQVISHNVANAETPGYSRQRVTLQENWPARLPEGILGTGVFVRDVSQVRNSLLDVAYRRDSSSAAGFGLRRDLLGQVEQIFHEPSEDGLNATLDAFWNSWSDLSNAPDNPAARQVVQQRGAQVAIALNAQAARLDEVRDETISQLNRSVGQLNDYARQVAELNGQIVGAEAGGQTAGDLRDSRNRIIDDMSKLASLQVIEAPGGGVAVIVNNQTLVDATAARSIAIGGSPPSLQLNFAGGTDPLTGVGGELSALTEVLNRDLVRTRARLDDLAAGVVSAVNDIHAEGWSPAAEPTPPAPADWAGSNVAFFTGTDAASIALSAEVAGNRDMVAAGATFGGTADNSIALRLSQLRDTGVSVGTPPSTITLANHYRDTVTTLALSTNAADSASTVHETLAAQSDTRRQSVSGVSTDEELVQLMRSQQAYVAATRLISAVDEMAQALLNMV